MRILFLFLLSPLGVFAQSTPYYLAGGLDNFSDQQFRGSSTVYLTRVGTDSLIISTSPTAYEHQSEYKLNPDGSFLVKTREWSFCLPNYVFLYKSGFFIIEEEGSYLVFMKDGKVAGDMLASNDQSKITHIKDSLRSVIVSVMSRQREAVAKTNSAGNKKIVTAYIRGYRSKREDPVLVRDIKKWSDNPTTSVYIADANYYITRNYRGEVINKNITAIIKYRLNGKCFIQWRSFGYEALGGGKFGTDLYTYNKNDFFLKAVGAGGSVDMDQGVAYEIECQ